MWEYYKSHGLLGTKRGICPVCGKKATRTMTFYQTQNPNKYGAIKTVQEILAECDIELEEWRKEPVYHAKCEVEQ